MSNDKHILYIEDNPGDQELLLIRLEESDFQGEIQIAEGLKAGLAKLKEQTFSLIFLDIELPDSTSLEHTVGDIEQATDTPIIILTGLSDEDIISKIYRNHKPLAVLQKPLPIRQLKSLIREFTCS